MKLIGTGSALPRRVVTNEEISHYLDTSDEWIYTRTGIKSRHLITDEHLEDLAVDAALKALDAASVSPSEIDLLICPVLISEYVTPGLGCIVAERIGLHCPIFDLNAACSGFLYAMDIAQTYFLARKVRKVLVVCADEPTRMTSWGNRSTSILFGDGAGAAVFAEGDNLKAVKLYSEPNSSKILKYNVLEPTPFVTKQEEAIPFKMNGREVFKYAVRTAEHDIKDILSLTGFDPQEIDFYMIHQANMRIVEAIRRSFGLPPEKFPTNIEDHGNSSAASCPILLDECCRKGMFHAGDKLVFSAFGAGLLSGAALLEW